MSTSTPSDGDMPPMFARSILGGKKSSKLEARVSDELKEAVRRKWVDMGFSSEAELIEYAMTVMCFGVEHVRMFHDQRLRMVGTLTDNGLTAGGAA